jgi:hypothetical protein
MVTPAAMVARPGTPPTQLAQLLGGQPFTIDAVYVWNTLPQTSPPGRVEQLGATVHLTFATPFAGTFTWPVKVYDSYDANGEAIGEYREGVWTFTAGNITDVDVVVDFAKSRIVEIRPGPTAIIQG